jgi:GR25 family glycosyltransferase involved in LPS biosynthesis
MKIPGSLRSNEKACFLSHKFAIKQNLNAIEPILIMEDDAVIGKSTCEILDNFIKLGNKFEWDILFTDICVPQPTIMIELIELRKKLSAGNKTQILNLADFVFAGATSYILNPNSLEKVFRLLDAKDSLDIPYDLYLRELIFENKLKGFVIFPFVTTLSNESDTSQIQLDDTANTDLVWNTFRKMIWMDRKIEDSKLFLERINHDVCDEESKQFGTIISACISNKFIPK